MFEMIDRELCDALMTYFEKRGVPFGETNARLLDKGTSGSQEDKESLSNLLAMQAEYDEAKDEDYVEDEEEDDDEVRNFYFSGTH
jgi:hypothetical protein